MLLFFSGGASAVSDHNVIYGASLISTVVDGLISLSPVAGEGAAIFPRGTGVDSEIRGDVVDGDGRLFNNCVSTGMLYDTYYCIILFVHLFHIVFVLFISLDF